MRGRVLLPLVALSRVCGIGPNCTLPGLERLTPKQYEGVVASYLSFATDVSSPQFRDRAREFQACTGGEIRFAEATNAFIDPIEDLGSRGRTGLGVHDAYFMSYSHFPEASSLELAEHLNDRLKEAQTYLQWEDIFPQVRNMGQFRTEGRNNLDFLMFDGDFFVPIVRLDLLEKYKKPLPNTWDEVVDLVKFFHGKDLNDDGTPDFGLCHFPRHGWHIGGHWDWWAPELIYSTWATYAQTGPEGFFFDPETLEPRLDTAAFRRAVHIWKEFWDYSNEGCVSPNVATGRCAIAYSPPGCWKGIFLDGVSRKSANGTVLWQPRMADGSYAEPYRLQPFGSTEVLDPATGRLTPCTRSLCPKAEPIKPRGHTDEGITGMKDRAHVLPESPLAGQLINRAPMFWSGGLGTLIRKAAPARNKDMLWDFFVYLNSPQTSVTDVAKYSSWIDSWRYSQLTPGGENFIIKSRWSPAAYQEHRSVMHASLGQAANGAFNLRIPGVKEYTKEVLGVAMQEFINDNLTEDAFVAKVLKGWNEINEARNKVHQLRTYRAALGLSWLSDARLCQLHREAMDKMNPATCRRFDPQSDQVYLTVLIVVGALVGVSLIAAFLLWVALTVRSRRRLLEENERRMEKQVRESLESIGTLKSPMVLCSAWAFYDLGQFVQYEELRDNMADLKIIDCFEDLGDFLESNYVIFLSHQWLSWAHPDPIGVQYNCAVQSTKHLVKEKNWDVAKVYIWCDFMSIPQRCSAIQTLAILSLPVYSSKVSAFIVISPTTQHSETDLECSVETYSRRAWCRAEVLSHALCKGMGNMYIANEAGIMAFGEGSSHVNDSVYVFEGDLTCCRMCHKGMESCDREKLVVPFLGLYSYVLHTLRWKNDEMDASTRSFFEKIVAEKKRIFPETFEFKRNDGRAETRKLFRGILELMETEVNKSSEEYFEDFRTLTVVTRASSGSGTLSHAMSSPRRQSSANSSVRTPGSMKRKSDESLHEANSHSPAVTPNFSPTTTPRGKELAPTDSIGSIGSERIRGRLGEDVLSLPSTPREPEVPAEGQEDPERSLLSKEEGQELLLHLESYAPFSTYAPSSARMPVVAEVTEEGEAFGVGTSAWSSRRRAEL